MKKTSERISEISGHLHTLSTRFGPQVQDAADKNDKSALVKLCEKANIPRQYIGTIVSVVFSVKPAKYPYEY